MENGRSRLQQAQDDVEEVKGIMLENLNKADERADKLGELENRAGELLEKGKKFQKTTKKVEEQSRWELMKMKVILSGIGVVVAAIIVGIIAYYISEHVKAQSNDEGSSAVEATSSGN